MKKLDQLTFTRFIAAFSVIVFHGGVGLFPFNFFPVIPLLSSGQTAVSYFFVLSGFVMALAYFNPEKRFDLRSYAAARFSRIYPVYILAFVFTALFYLEIMGRMKPAKIWANIFLYQAWVPRFSQSFNMAAWSLSVEAFFYLLFPLLVLLYVRLPARKVIWLTLGFWIVSNVFHGVLYAQYMPQAHLFLDYFPLFHLSAFLVGTAGGVWYKTVAPRLEINSKTNSWLMFGSLALISLALMWRYLQPGLFQGMTLDNGLLAPLFAIFVVTLALDTTWVSRWLSKPVLVLLGDASYALYILHVPVRWWIERGLAALGDPISFDTMYYFYMPLMVLLSVAVFLWIERPSRDWLRLHMDKLPLMVLDILLIAVAVYASFAIRLGVGQDSMEHAQLYALRVAIPLYLLALILVRAYDSARPLWQSLGIASAAGGLVFAGLMYLGWTSGWIEGFPRLIVALNPLLTFLLVFASRMLLRLFWPRPALAGKQA